MSNDNNLISLAEAVAHFPARNGKHPHLKSIRRRILTGCRGVKLRAIKDGSNWFTTVEWIKQFQEECTRQAMPNQVEHPQVRNERHEAAKELLKQRYGFHVGKTASGKKEDYPTTQGPRGRTVRPQVFDR